jgi:hypothetical protein
MGGDNVTIKNLRIVDVDKEIMLIAVAIPGPKHSLIKIYGKGEKAEEVIDHAAEEEKLAQEKMLEADKEAKESHSAEARDEEKAQGDKKPDTEDKPEETKTEEQPA